MLQTLEIVNGTHPTLRGDPHSPGGVIRALNQLGWIIPPADEHDAHELLHVMLCCLEEESIKPRKIGCLSDALGNIENQPPRPSSAMLTDFFLHADYEEYQSNGRQMSRSEAHTPDSPHSTCTDTDEVDTTLIDQTLSSSVSTLERPSRLKVMTNRVPGDGINKRSSFSCRSLERGPGKISVWNDNKATIQVPHPFRGALNSQLCCSSCGFKSVVRYDKFDSISLPLPEMTNAGLSLGFLLSEFVTPETISDVTCDSCNEKTNHTKHQTFAKLPGTLCIHLARTTWLKTGQICKRQDFIHFPETLSMGQYSFVQSRLNSQASTPWGSTFSLLSSSMPSNSEPYSFGFGGFPRNLYRLLAVVVHSGEASSGHFVTFRRGALRNSHKWFYTSDAIIKEISLEEVLGKSAYMLFYDRGPQKMTGM